ncbi:MAG TPA: heavy metal-binding domain-containing protein, partial [Verrucomicrobiae bacterium]|nr:heavy metal-binding domain-containing protein [Verrucomicrobiae bacterium]
MKGRFLLLILALATAGALGWHLGKRNPSSAGGVQAGRKVAFYQSPMHPWIKSDKPGNCTICGM